MVAFHSAHLPTADSEVLVSAGQAAGGFRANPANFEQSVPRVLADTS